MKFATCFAVIVFFCGSACISPSSIAQLSGSRPCAQHFVCTGYTLEKCLKVIPVLRKVLQKYPAHDLGEWTWILVRSEDWKRLVEPRGLNPDSPAFTYYDGKETFFEEALLTPVPARSARLMVAWGMSTGQLLDFAVTHELAHSLCNERDEAAAERVARLLRLGAPPSCQATLQARKGHAQEIVPLTGRNKFD